MKIIDQALRKFAQSIERLSLSQNQELAAELITQFEERFDPVTEEDQRRWETLQSLVSLDPEKSVQFLRESSNLKLKVMLLITVFIEDSEHLSWFGLDIWESHRTKKAIRENLGLLNTDEDLWWWVKEVIKTSLRQEMLTLNKTSRDTEERILTALNFVREDSSGYRKEVTPFLPMICSAKSNPLNDIPGNTYSDYLSRELKLCLRRLPYPGVLTFIRSFFAEEKSRSSTVDARRQFFAFLFILKQREDTIPRELAVYVKAFLESLDVTILTLNMRAQFLAHFREKFYKEERSKIIRSLLKTPEPDFTWLDFNLLPEHLRLQPFFSAIRKRRISSFINGVWVEERKKPKPTKEQIEITERLKRLQSHILLKDLN